MATAPLLEEPKSPMWLPALGATLFLLAGVAWMLVPPDPPPSAAGEGAGAAAAAADGGSLKITDMKRLADQQAPPR